MRWFDKGFPNGPRIAYPSFGASFVSVPFKPAFMSAQVGQTLEGTVRDIRGDLQERAILVDEQMMAAAAHYDKAIQRLQNERDARIADLKSGLAMIAKFTEFEQRVFGNVSPPIASSSSPLVALADLFMHRLAEAGSMSREQLADLAVREGFFPDAESAVQGVHP